MKGEFSCPHCGLAVIVQHVPWQMVSCPSCQGTFSLPDLPVAPYAAGPPVARGGPSTGMIVGIVLGSVAAVVLLVGGVLALTWSSTEVELQRAEASQRAAKRAQERSETRRMISEYEHKHGSARRPIVVVGKDGKRTFAKNVNRRSYDPNYTAIWNYLIKEIDTKRGTSWTFTAVIQTSERGKLPFAA